MTRSKLSFRPRASVLALEPRVLFDGAGAMAAVDYLADVPAKTESAKEVEAEKTPATAAPVTLASPRAEDAGISRVGTDSVITTVLIVDTRVADYASLLATLPADTLVHVVGEQESGLAALTQALQGRQGVESVQILSHGTLGSFTLGSDTIDAASIGSHRQALQDWAGALTDDADILLYGCETGAGEQGMALLTQLAALTGADVAASNDATGAAVKGGDWELEINTGAIEARLALDSAAVGSYAHLLAAPAVTNAAPPDAPVTVGENSGGSPGANITVAGTGADTLTVSASVTKGALSAATFTGDAAAVQTWLAGLTYTYTGNSETGDVDTLTLSIVNNTSGGTAPFSRAFTIAPENDVPVITPPASGAGRLIVAEGGSTAFVLATGNGTAGNQVAQVNLGLSDPDNSQAQIIIKLTAPPTKGTLLLNGNEITVGSTFSVSSINQLVYKHGGDQVLSTTTDTFQITVDDGAGGIITLQNVVVDITPVNQAPAAGGNIILIEGETAVPLVGGTVPVITGPRGDLTITDPDDSAGTHSVQITSLPAHGTLKYNGVSVTNGQMIVDANLALFSYDHDGGENQPTDSFTLAVSDDGGGTGVPATTTNHTVNLTIIPNNDDPYWDSTTEPDGAGNFPPVEFGPDSGTGNLTTTLPITSSLLKALDVDSPVVTYTLTSIPTGGYLSSTDFPGQFLPVNFTFTQADIDAGRISYVRTTGSSGTDAFQFTVKDGDRRLIPTERDGGIYTNDSTLTPLVHTFQIDYQGTATGTGPGAPITAAPTPTVGGTLSLGIADIAEGQFYTLSTAQLSATSTGVAPEQLTYRLLSLPTNGSITLNNVALPLLGSFTHQDIIDGNVRFAHGGSEDFNASFTFDVSNGSITSSIATFNIEVKPQNDTPTAVNTDVVKLTEGSTIVINAGGKAHIALEDSDNDTSDRTDGFAADNAISFNVSVLPTRGDLYLSGVLQTVSFVVTKAQLDGGLLTYQHDGSENYTDSFTIVPLDDKGVVISSSNTNANISDPATDPTNQTSQGVPAVVNISVNPLNDAPTFVSIAEPGYGNVAALKEGATLIIAGATSYTASTHGIGSGTAAAPADTVAHLLYQDSDNTSEQRQYRITAMPQYGTLSAGGRVLGVGSVFTQDELDSGAVQYKHGGGEQFDDKFEYVVSDGDYSANQNGSAAQGVSITPSEFRIRLERSNDKPTVTTAHTGLFVVDSSVMGKTLPSISLGDIDLIDGTQAGESDFIQVSVEFLSAADAAYGNGVLQFESGYNPATQGDGVVVTNAAGDNTLVFQGKLADVQAALSKVQARTSGTDADAADLKIKVTIDDRLRDGSGSLTADANGGALNQDGTAPNGTFNTASITINVAASDVNDLPVVTANDQSVNEDVRTLLSSISYTDPDAFGSTNNTVTLTVDTGRLYFAASGNSITGGASLTSGTIGSTTVTLSGTKAQLDTALANLYYQSATDYNGADSLTITVADGSNTGADGIDGNAADASKTVAIAIVPVNDAPVINGSIPASALKPITGTSYVFQTGELNFQDDKDTANAIVGFELGSDEYTVTLAVDSGTLALATTAGLTTVAGNGTSTVSLTGTMAAIKAVITTPGDNVTFAASLINGDAAVNFTMTVNDLGNGGVDIGGNGGDLTASRSFQFIPTDVNNAPTVVGLTDRGYTENTTITLDTDVNLVDPELDLYPNWSGAVLTIGRDGGANPQDVFGLTGSGTTGVNFQGSNIRIGTTVVGTYANTGGTLEITFNSNANAGNVDIVARAVTYTNTSDKPPAAVTLRYTINDQNQHAGDTPPLGSGQDQGSGGPLSGSATITLNITKLVDAPVLSTPPALNAQFTENGATPVVVDNGFTLTDADDDNIHSARVAITGNFLAGDLLAVDTAGTNITASYNAITGELTLTGEDTKDNYQQVLRSLSYSTPSDDPTLNTTRPTRTLTYTVYDAGSDGSGTAGANPGTTTRTIDVLPVNDQPVLAGAGSTRSYTENGPALVLEPLGWTLTDLDDTQMVSITAQIISGRQVDDVLAIPGGSLPAGWTQSYDAATGTLTLSGAATDISNVTTALAAVTYRNTGENPGNTDRVVTWRVRDANSDAAANGQLLSDTVTTTIQVTPVNDPPVATPNTNSVTEDTGTPAIGNIKTNGTADSDPDNVMTDVPVTSVTATTAGGSATPVMDNSGAGTVVTGKYGTLTIQPDGSYSYALDNNNPDVNALNDTQTLVEEFSYTITDPGLLSANSTLTITINGHTEGAPQILPVDGNGGAATGQATVYERGLTPTGGTTETTTGTITVTAGDGIAKVTIGGQEFTVAQLDALSSASPSAIIDTGEGQLRITGISDKLGAPGAPTAATVSYTYTLKAAIVNSTAAETESTDTIALVVTDSSSTPKTGTGNLAVQIIDDVPVAASDARSITRGTASVGGNALTNDAIGADGAAVGGPVTAIAGSAPGTPVAGTYGAITLNADGTYTYALNNANPAVANLLSGQTLTETFNYAIVDADGDAATATITITINGFTPNQVPVAVNDAFTLDEDLTFVGSLVDNDTPSPDGGNVWTKASDPQHGTVVVGPTGRFVYVPDPDYNGTDSFTYTITDVNGDQSTATVTLTVNPTNDVPVAVNDTATTPKDVPINGNLTGNDTPSGDGDNVWTKTTDPTNGTVVVNPDGTYTYTPTPGYTGRDSFTYTITDKDGDKSTATVRITVAATAVPVAVDDSTTTPKDVPVNGNLEGNDKPSADGGNVWTKTTDPTNGTVVVNPDGSYTYTPNLGYEGPDSFTYTITDKDGDKSTATVTITVTPPVTPPVPPLIEPRPDVPLPAPTVPQVPLQPLNPLQSDQAREESVYFDGGVFTNVVRLSIPLHPVVYVSPGVNEAQALREATDSLTFSNPAAVRQGGIQSRTIGMGLGFDPALFVQHAVRDAQARGEWWSDLVEGRLGRLSLGSDGRIATPEWFEPSDAQIVPHMPGQEEPAAEADKPTEASPRPNAGTQSERVPAVAATAQRATSAAAPSFSEQLRNAGGRPLPAATRPVSNGPIAS